MKIPAPLSVDRTPACAGTTEWIGGLLARPRPRSVAVLRGGRSAERPISLASGEAVLGALRADGRVERLLDVVLELDGRWRIDGEPCSLGSALERLAEVDVCFLALHGGDGEGGGVQGLLEAAGRVYTGSGQAASALAIDKWLTRLFLGELGVRFAPGFLVTRGEGQTPAAAASQGAARVLGALESPSGWFVKPRRGGSSLATLRVEASGPDAADALTGAIEAVLRAGDDALVETRVVGVELTTAVLGNAPGPLFPLPAVEIAPRGQAFFDYTQKYADDGAHELCPAPSLDPLTAERLGELAVSVHRAVGCLGFSRSDWILPPAAEGAPQPVCLEVNTLPGLTERSLVPLAARQAGWGLADVSLALCALATEAASQMHPA